MADEIQTGVHYILILLGIIVVALAVWMASENLWWIAVPDAIFGIGVAWLSFTSVRGEGESHTVEALGTVPELPRSTPPPAPEPRLSASEPTVTASTALPHPAEPPAPASSPYPRHGKKKKHRH
ncbi:MAG: hypothetical protein ACRD1Y_01195 [Terriglobales bacterium]